MRSLAFVAFGALAAAELEPPGGSTRVRLTVQVVSLEGSDMIAGSKTGYDSALDNLVRYVQTKPAQK